MSISVVIIALNEEDRIEKCVKSALRVSDDVIVIDTGSTDNTIEVASKARAKVIREKWIGYGPTKNIGHQYVQNDWILSLDSDEWLSDTLASEINGLPLDKDKTYQLNRQNHYLKRPINFSGWNPDWVNRLFHKNKAKWNSSLVHERLDTSNTTLQKLNGRLMHESYRSEADYLEKIEKYAKLKAQIWHKKNIKPSLLKRSLGPVFKAFQTYFLKFGFMDGAAGIQIALKNMHMVKRQLHYYDKQREQ